MSERFGSVCGVNSFEFTDYSFIYSSQATGSRPSGRRDAESN